jgi:hypothetical protein
MCLVEAVYRQ